MGHMVAVKAIRLTNVLSHIGRSSRIKGNEPAEFTTSPVHAADRVVSRSVKIEESRSYSLGAGDVGHTHWLVIDVFKFVQEPSFN